MKKLLAAALILLMPAALFVNGSSAQSVDIGLCMPETTVERWQRDGDELKASVGVLDYSVALRSSPAKSVVKN